MALLIGLAGVCHWMCNAIKKGANKMPETPCNK